MRHRLIAITRNRATPQSIPEYSICLVREPLTRFQTRPISRSKIFYCTFKKAFERLDRENFAVVTVDAKNVPIGFNIVAVGSLTLAVVHPREVFKMAVLQNAVRVFLAHNHPSGSVAPSCEDIALTRRLVEAGNVLGIEVVDHVIFGRNRYLSFADENLLQDDGKSASSKEAGR